MTQSHNPKATHICLVSCPASIDVQLGIQKKVRRHQWLSIWFGCYCCIATAVLNAVTEDPLGFLLVVVSIHVPHKWVQEGIAQCHRTQCESLCPDLGARGDRSLQIKQFVTDSEPVHGRGHTIAQISRFPDLSTLVW